MKDNNFYVRFSSDVRRGLKQHIKGEVKSTKNKKYKPYIRLGFESSVAILYKNYRRSFKTDKKIFSGFKKINLLNFNMFSTAFLI